MVSRKLCCFALLVASCSAACASPEQWLEVRSDHFTVITNAGEKQGRHFLDQFERMRWVFQTLYHGVNVDPPAPIVVIAAKNTKTFQAFEPAPYLAKGQLNLAGYFLTTQDRNYVLVRLDAEQDEHPFATVYHEYTHLQFRGMGEYMPLWLNEGMAEFFQNTDIHDKNVILGQPSTNDILYLRQERLIPLPVLFKVDASSPYYHEEQRASVFYAESWALTHYLEITNRQNHADTIDDYLRRLRNHEDPVVAAQEAFGDLKQLQAALDAYIREGRYMQFVLNSAAAPLDEASYKVRPLTSIEADNARAEVLANVQREKESRDLLASILQADPNNAQARETMGNLEFRAGNRDAARKWYGEAAALNSKSYLADYYFASISMESGDNIQDPAIESSLRACIQLSPNFSPAYERLGTYYGMRNIKTDEALALIKQAVKLDPGNIYYRVNFTNILVAQGHYAEATTILKAAANLARNPGELAIVQNQLQRVDQIQQQRTAIENARRAADAQPPQGRAQSSIQVVSIAEVPKHPADANGPKHIALGVIHDVTCSYPSVIEFRVVDPKAAVAVYSNDFSKINLTALGFTPTGDINPCTDLEGMKARVQYAETTDKTVAGQVFAIELRK